MDAQTANLPLLAGHGQVGGRILRGVEGYAWRSFSPASLAVESAKALARLISPISTFSVIDVSIRNQATKIVFFPNIHKYYL